MQMRIKLFHIPVAGLLAVVSASLGCAGEKKPVAVLPAFQGAPPIHAAAQAATPQKPAAAAAPAVTVAPAPAPEVKPAEPKPDAAAELVAKADKERQAGEDEYNAGNKDAAKQHYDLASALLTTAPSEVRSDPRVQQELDRRAGGSQPARSDRPAASRQLRSAEV